MPACARLGNVDRPALPAFAIIDIVFAAGFGDASHFNRVFRRRFGDTPSGVRTAAIAPARK
jgi:transcriptional regulator GlxA family with amidase domain